MLWHPGSGLFVHASAYLETGLIETVVPPTLLSPSRRPAPYDGRYERGFRGL
ncbi:hypothetical protein BH09ACT8_BH09ACT8_46660 [soil metagenome]